MSLLSRSGTRYSKTEIKDFYLDIWVPVEINPTYSDKTITLAAKYHERPDLLSFDEYGTVIYWWVFMERNKDVLFDPVYDFKAGITIIVPPLDSFEGS